MTDTTPAQPSLGENQKTKIFRDTASLNIALIVGQGLTAFQAITLMRALGPESYGIWLGVLLLIGYASYAHLGLEYGLDLRLLYYSAKGEASRAADIRDTVYTAWSMIGLAVGATFVTSAILLEHQPLQQRAFFCVAAIVIFEQQIAFHSRLLTSLRKDFVSLSKAQVLRNAISFSLLVPLGFWGGLNAVFVGAVGVAFLTLIYYCWLVRFVPRIVLKRDALREVFRIGFPAGLVVVGGVLIESIDRIIVLQFLGAASLGYYGITTLGSNSLYRLIAQAGSTMLPHMIEEMGRSDDSPAALRPYLVNPTIVFANLSALLIIASLAVLPPFVNVALPRYVSGIPALYAFLPGVFFLCIILSANNILNLILIARRKQRVVLFVQLVAIAVKTAVAALVVWLGAGISGVAFASTLAYAVYGSSILQLAASNVFEARHSSDRTKFMWAVYTPFAIAVVPWLILWWLDTGGTEDVYAIAPLVLRAVVVVATGVALLLTAARSVSVSALMGLVKSSMLKRLAAGES